ncbi:hypothetical protein NSA56_06550 [Oceanobacillus caeni]|nr:hypothetical protein [Oceanobacillus caeni]MCR1834051.1 hypothetical protein [Oceanobacillus caeni]
MENICVVAYRGYLSICERYGMKSVSFYHFIGQLTEEQINEYSKLAI